jgi:hypothetical protein
LPAEKRLRIPYVAGAEHEDFNQPLIAVARSGKHVAFANERWTTGLEQWQFGLPSIYYSGQDALRGTVTAERGMYRPGDSVHLLGVLRQRLPNGKLAPPPGSVEAKVSDPDGNQVFSQKLALSEFGTFRAKLGIGRSARLGKYVIVASKGATELRSGFEVGEYRPVRFEVKLPPAGRLDPGIATISLPISASYLYGAPVAGGSCAQRVGARARSIRPVVGWLLVQQRANVGAGRAERGRDQVDAGHATISRQNQRRRRCHAGQSGAQLIFEASHDAAATSLSAKAPACCAPGAVGLKSDSWAAAHRAGP